MEITWKVVSGEQEGERGKRYREMKHKWHI